MDACPLKRRLPHHRRAWAGALLAILAAVPAGTGQVAAQQLDATTQLEMVRRLSTTGRALVITARPEEEPAGLTAWLHLRAGAEVGVLALHRGEGSGNRFGREIGEALGVLRVQEIQQLRRQTGGHQFFTRAFDIGTPAAGESVWQRWPRALVLADLVTAIRSLRPHILVVACGDTGGPPDPQRTAALELAEEAFTAAADTAVVSLELGAFRPPWQPTHLYQAGCDGAATLTVDLGEVHGPRGATFATIGAVALGSQRSQGLGALPRPTPPPPMTMQRRRSLVPDPPDPTNMFAGLQLGWHERSRDPGLPAPRRQRLDAIERAIAAVQQDYDVRDPSRAVRRILEAIRAVRDGRALLLPSADRRLPWRAEEADLDAALTNAESRLTALVLAAAGVTAQFRADRGWVAQGDTLTATLLLQNRGGTPVSVASGQVEFGRLRRFNAMGDTVTVPPGSEARWTITLQPLDATIPWWLAVRRVNDAYTYPPGGAALPEQLIGEGSSRYGRAAIQLSIDGVPLSLVTDPLGHAILDPDRGEVVEPVLVMPPVTVLLERMLDYAPADRPSGRLLRVELRSWTTRPRDVEVRLEAPNGVSVAGNNQKLTLSPGETRELEFELGVQLPRDRHALRVFAESEGETFVQGVIPIRYPHIDPVVVQRPSGLWLDAVPVSVPAGVEIGYLAGVRDFNQIAFRQLLLRVTDLAPGELDSARLAGLRRIVVGPGAMTVAETRRAVPALRAWVGRGGRLVVHDPGLELLDSGLLPWPVNLVAAPRPLGGRGFPLAPAPGAERWWRTPHRLDDLDLNDWHNPVATTLPAELDPRYTPILLAREAPDDPGTAVGWSTRIGRGTLVYTTLQLPTQVLAGEGGALRLLLNLLLAPDGG